jgi:predicted transcriptional regulator
MDVLWSADEPLRVRELLAVLNRDVPKPWAYNTVQTVAERLTAKGLLRRTPDGNAFRYSPTRSREEHTVALMMDALSDSADQGAILARFAESMDPDAAQTLLDVLRERAADDQKG